MNSPSKKEDNYLMSFSDVRSICRQSRIKIVFGVVLFACLFMLIALTRPVQYMAKATFREKAKTASEVPSKTLSLALLTGSNEGTENAAISMMKSRVIFEKSILQHDLQATIMKDEWTFKPLTYLKDHIAVDYALLRDVMHPVLKDPPQWIKARNIHYQGETPLHFVIQLTSEDTYVVKDHQGTQVGFGEIGKAFSGANYDFTLERKTDEPLNNLTFKMTLDPVPVVARRLVARFKCQPDTRDRTLLCLSFMHGDRYEASDFLNSLMDNYRAYLISEHQRISYEQLNYLHQRQDETATELKIMMEKHAQAISSNMATMDFLFQNQQAYTQKQLTIDLELRRLQNARDEGLAFYDRFWIDGGDPVVINQLLSDIRSFRQQADSIDIALRNLPAQNADVQKAVFAEQMAELERIRATAQQARILYGASQKNDPLPELPIFAANDSKYMIQAWLEKVGQNELAFQQAQEADKQNALRCLEECKTSFNAYLANLIHSLDVEGKIIEERLTHQQAPHNEFQGIDLVMAKQLYMDYSKVLNDIEADILQHTFILSQMREPHFEPSSLSPLLQDAVSHEMINRASHLALQIKDQDNHSQKELERLRTELAQQKGFLILHVEQMKQLLQLRHDLYQDKLQAVQKAQLELIQQKISVLEKHLGDYIDNRMISLKQERQALEQQQAALQREMAKMPEKWASEKLIEQHLEMNRKMIEEITKIVEQKNISAHLDISQSAPVDKALPPIHPTSSYFILLGFLGSLFGFIFMVSFVVGRAAVKGIPASPDNLRFLGHRVLGKLSKGAEKNLDVLRSLSAQLPSTKQSKTLLLLINQGYDYSSALASLLSKRGLKVIIIPLIADSQHGEEEPSDLLHYLEGTGNVPMIYKTPQGYSKIIFGGECDHTNELVGSKRFTDLMDLLRKQYDWVIIVSQASPTHGEGEHLLHIFDHAVVTVNGETLPELEACFEISSILYLF